MYKVVLIDDDNVILSGLSKLIGWEKYNCRITGTFEDPFSALSFCSDNHPDIIITDIRMPGMLGLELIAKLRPILPSTVLIMLTAYDDFEYAKQALNNGAFRYLLKPIDEKALIDSLLEAGRFLEKQRHTTQELQELDSYRTTKKHKDFLYRLLSMAPPAGIDDECDDLFVNGALRPYYLAATPTIQALQGTEMVASKYPCFCLHTSVYDLYLLVDTGESPDAWQNKLICEAKKVDRHIAFMRSPSLIQLYSDSEFLTAYLDARSFLSTDTAFFVRKPPEQLKRSHHVLLDNFTDTMTNMPSTFFTGSHQEFRNTLDKVERMLTNSEYPLFPNTVKTAFSGMLLQLSDHYGNYGCYAECVETVKAAAKKIVGCSSYSQIRENCMQVFGEIIEKTRSTNESSSLNVVNTAKAYISMNFNQDISIKTIAQAAFVNPSYLSSLFKKATGENLWSYVTRIRLEKAYDYLKNTDRKISQIAQDCGFQNINTFYYAFKKEFGFAPGKFRQDSKED